MGVLAPILAQCQPAAWDGGLEGGGTEGATWEHLFEDVEDQGHVPIDLTGIGGECNVWESLGGLLVATFVITGQALGRFTLRLEEATTAGLAGAAGASGRRCVWGCFLDDGDDIAQLWMPSNSVFTIWQEA